MRHGLIAIPVALLIVLAVGPVPGAASLCGNLANVDLLRSSADAGQATDAFGLPTTPARTVGGHITLPGCPIDGSAAACHVGLMARSRGSDATVACKAGEAEADPVAQHWLGAAELTRGDLAAGIARWQSIGAGGPLATLGLTMYEAERWPESEAALEATVTAGYRAPIVYIRLADLTSKRGDLAASRRWLEAGIRERSDSATLYQRLGRITAEQGDIAAAEQSYRRAIELSPNGTSPRLELARLLAENGKADQARQLACESLALDAERADAVASILEVTGGSCPDG